LCCVLFFLLYCNYCFAVHCTVVVCRAFLKISYRDEEIYPAKIKVYLSIYLSKHFVESYRHSNSLAYQKTLSAAWGPHTVLVFFLPAEGVPHPPKEEESGLQGREVKELPSHNHTGSDRI